LGGGAWGDFLFIYGHCDSDPREELQMLW